MVFLMTRSSRSPLWQTVVNPSTAQPAAWATAVTDAERMKARKARRSAWYMCRCPTQRRRAQSLYCAILQAKHAINSTSARWAQCASLIAPYASPLWSVPRESWFTPAITARGRRLDDDRLARFERGRVGAGEALHAAVLPPHPILADVARLAAG